MVKIRKPKMSPSTGDIRQLKDMLDAAEDKLADTADAAHDRVTEAAGAATAGAIDLAARAKTSVNQRRSRNKATPTDLSKLPAEAKLLYCRVLALQAKGDGVLDPREIANLYLFASALALDEVSRTALRSDISASRPDTDNGDHLDRAPDALTLATRLSGALDEGQREAVLTLLVRDLLRISRADAQVSGEERSRIGSIAAMAFADTGGEVLRNTERLVVAEEDCVAGRITTKQLEARTKDLVADAAALGTPIGAISVAGSVSGLSAAGITSGLATLGFGGLLGLSAMVTGIGTVVVLGVAVHQGTRYVLGANERERTKRRESVIQEVIRHHQLAMADLNADIADLARRMEEHLSQTARNEDRLARLRTELASFQLALADLQQSHERFERREPVRGR